MMLSKSRQNSRIMPVTEPTLPQSRSLEAGSCTKSEPSHSHPPTVLPRSWVIIYDYFKNLRTTFIPDYFSMAANFDDRSNMLTYLQVSLKLLFAYKLSYKKSKSVKHRVSGSFFRRYQLIKDRGTQICTPPIWIGLNEFDNSHVRLWCELFLL